MSHFNFWISFAVKRSPKIYLAHYKKALQHEDLYVREVALSNVALFKNHIEELLPEIKNCIENEEPEIRFRAIYAWSLENNKTHAIFENPFYKKIKNKLTDLEYSIAIFLFIYHHAINNRNLNPQEFNMNNLKGAILLFNSLQENFSSLPTTTKCIVSACLSSLNFHLDTAEMKKIKDYYRH